MIPSLSLIVGCFYRESFAVQFFFFFKFSVSLKIFNVSRALATVVLNCYIAIFSTTKYQNVPCNSEAKAIFFGSRAIVHNYFWLCIVVERLKKKKKLRSHCFCLSPHYLSVSLPMSTMRSHYFWLWLCFGG